MTATSAAGGLNPKLNTAYTFSGSGVKASGATVTLTSIVAGSAGNYSLSTTNGADFGETDSGSSLAGGINGTTTYDAGTVTVTINNTTATASWGQGSTANSLASAIATAINTADSGFLSASASGTVVSLTSTQASSDANWPISITVTDSNSASFPTPSFAVSAAGMSGGASPGYSSGVIYSYSVPSSGGYAANGDLLSYTDSVMGQWSFSYDKLDRLMTGTPSSGPYQGQYGCWNYDSFGNRTVNVVSAAACTTTATATYNANNQITWLQTLGAPGYSPAGNVASDSLNQYLYDNENRVCAVRNVITNGMTGYLYDGGGARVAKGAVANLNACPAAQGFVSITAQYLLGPGGEQVTELDGSGNWQHTNLFAAGRLLTTYDTRGQHFHFTDWLGTKRAQTTAAGVSEEQCQSLPFGDGLSCSGSGVDATEHHFTGKERDTESGNDYFGARYYSSTVGRFMTPDWSLKAEPVPYARLDIPQTLNLYAYVGNNPLTHTDVDGHAANGNDDSIRDPQADQLSQEEEQRRNAEAKAKNEARQAQQQKTDNLSNVVENETSSLKADPNAKPGQPGSAENLAAGQLAVAEVANRVIDAGHPDRVASSTLYDSEAAGLKKGDRAAVDAHNRSRTAAEAAVNGSNTTNGATQYRTRVGSNVTTPLGRSKTNPGTPVSMSFGPFIEGKHTVVIVVAP